MDSIQKAVDDLFIAHRRMIISILFRIVKCRHTAEDLTQEAYLRVQAAVTRYPVIYIQPFLYQTAKNLALDYLRMRQTRERVLDYDTDEDSVNDVIALSPSPETMVDNEKLFDHLSAIMERLPERQRQILALHKFYGWRYGEIASQLGVSVSTVEKDIRKALIYCLSNMPVEVEK